MTNERIGDEDETSRLSLYLYYAEQTEKLIERRAANSRYFLTINTAFVAILGLAIEHDPDGSRYWVTALPLAGITVCVLWAQLVRSYRDLTAARFEVINEMETALVVAPYTDEWKRIKQSPAYRGYTSIARLEALVPWVFVTIYAVLLIAPLIVGGATNPIAPPNP